MDPIADAVVVLSTAGVAGGLCVITGIRLGRRHQCVWEPVAVSHSSSPFGLGETAVYERCAKCKTAHASVVRGRWTLHQVLRARGYDTCSCDGDPIECSHEAARGQAEAERDKANQELALLRQELRRLEQTTADDTAEQSAFDEHMAEDADDLLEAL